MSDQGEPARLTIWVRGRVQGVGFRWWSRAQALRLGLAGTATNLDDGRVEIVVEGSAAACRDLLAAVRSGGTPGHVTGVVERWGTPKGLDGFREG
ncbi:MAG: acylphosphatase [Actinomycetes bacterium]